MKVHIAGIGGVGMSALAQALIDQGVVVSGSDRLWDHGTPTPTLLCLQRQGVALFPQDGSGLDAHTARLVVSSAIEDDSPEIVRAGERGIPVVHRASELARLTGTHDVIAVTGTSGKSSVTAILGHLLAATGFDPMVVNGAAVSGWSLGGTRIGAVRPRAPGAPRWAVVEADESDRSLLAFRPQHAIITNVSADHFSLAESEALFDTFCTQVKGQVVDGRHAPLEPQEATCAGWQGHFVFEDTTYTVPLPGLHNIYNAWQAVRLARLLGAPAPALVRALAHFGGIERRLQRVGYCGGALVIDDYAHNPEKLAAAWQTVAQVAPAGICGVWRPHGYGPLRKMMDDLQAAFARVLRPQDHLLLLPVYDAGGSANRSINSDLLASKLLAKGARVSLVKDLEEAEHRLCHYSTADTVLLILGARDPGLPELARRLAAIAT